MSIIHFRSIDRELVIRMSVSQSINQSDQQQEHHVIKYLLDKLEKYAHKSHLWHLIHASHLRRNLLRRSRHLSKIHSISEDLVRQCINQLFNDVDQYVEISKQIWRMLLQTNWSCCF